MKVKISPGSGVESGKPGAGKIGPGKPEIRMPKPLETGRILPVMSRGRLDTGSRTAPAEALAAPVAEAPAGGVKAGPPPGIPAADITLLENLNLARDDLSTALVSFVRYFSLALDPGLLTRLRRSSLAAVGGKDSRAPVAAALAAAAAEAKGVELSGDALAHYAEAVDAESRGGSYDDHSDNNDDGKYDNKYDDIYDGLSSGEVDGGDLKKAAGDVEKKDTVLSLLNALPGGDGSRWLVYPLDIHRGGVDFRVSIRIKLVDEGLSGERVLRAAVDIFGGKRRWRFILDNPGKDRGETRVLAVPSPRGAEKRRWETELGLILGGRVTLCSGEIDSPFADSRLDSLSGINEEV